MHKNRICPFCNKADIEYEPVGFEFEVLDRLKVVGGGRREYAKCSECSSTDRERLVYLYLKNFTSLFDDSLSVLHIAPEKRLRDKIEENTKLDYTTADLKKTFVDMNFDLCEIPLEDDRFDIIICNHVLEHIVDDEKAMKELFRILKPNGFAVLQVPFSPLLDSTYEDETIVSEEDREMCFGQGDHVRIYGLDYINRLESSGFSVEKFIWQSHEEFSKYDYGLADNEPIFIAKK